MKKVSINKNIFYLIYTVFLLLNIQCERFVEVEEPTNQISQAMVFKDKQTAISALANVYANLRSNSLLDGSITGSNFLTACYSDEITTITNQSSGFRTFYDLTLQSTTSEIDFTWANAYKAIYASNNIIEGVAKSAPFLDESTRNSLTGEALAIRAIIHLNLSGLFGEVPYVTSTDYKINNTITKSTLPDIYTQLKNDLQSAESLLTDSYPTPNRTRINKGVVRLILARIFLYEKDYNNARQYANLLTRSPVYSVEPSLDAVFLKDAKSTIWHFAPSDSGANTLEGPTFIIRNTPPPYGSLTQNLLSSFESTDLRLTKWTKIISKGSESYQFPFKYKQYTKTPTSLEYSVILRIEEAYLIAAEAENKLGNTAAALQNLQITRRRAGLLTPTSLSQQEIQNMIIQEKRHEFFTEGNHRFLDLKRWNLLDTTMQQVKPQWESFMKNWPLPQSEILINQNLKPQNDGY